MQNRIKALDRRELAILITIGANVVLVGLKYGLFALSGSMALKASAWHSFGDVFSSLLVFAGFLINRFLSGKREKYTVILENFIALFMAALIFYMATDIYRDAMSPSDSSALTNLWPVAIASLLTIAITYFTARYKEFVGRSTETLSLVASGYHSRLDLYSSLLVLISLFSSALGMVALDRFSAMIICLFIVVSGWEIAVPALGALKAAFQNTNLGRKLPYQHLTAKTLLFVGLGGFLAMTVVSGFSIVQIGEKGVVTRFGKVDRELSPGLQYHIPFIEDIRVVSVDEIRNLRLGTKLILTGDTNLLNVEMSVQYWVKDPAKFLSGNANTTRMVADSAETALATITATHGVDDLLVGKRREIADRVKNGAQALLDTGLTGLEIASVQLVSVVPPEEVAEAFRDVASAREDKSTYISEALVYRNEVVPLARGESVRNVLAAEAEKRRKADVSAGEAERFTLRSRANRESGEVNRNRYFFEAMERALPKARKFIVDPRVVANPTQLWLSQGSRLPGMQ